MLASIDNPQDLDDNNYIARKRKRKRKIKTKTNTDVSVSFKQIRQILEQLSMLEKLKKLENLGKLEKLQLAELLEKLELLRSLIDTDTQESTDPREFTAINLVSQNENYTDFNGNNCIKDYYSIEKIMLQISNQLANHTKHPMDFTHASTDYKMLELLLQQNDNVGTYKQTEPLLMAVSWKLYDIIRLLLKHKADPYQGMIFCVSKLLHPEDLDLTEYKQWIKVADLLKRYHGSLFRGMIYYLSTRYTYLPAQQITFMHNYQKTNLLNNQYNTEELKLDDCVINPVAESNLASNTVNFFNILT